jgi:hypothetical protein
MLTGIGVALVVGWFISSRANQKKARAKQREDAVSGANVRNDITRVGNGGVLAIPNFEADGIGTLETYVKSRNRYSEDGESWFELVCEYKGRELLVEWEREGRSTSISAGFEDKNPSLADLGLDEPQLVEFDESERGSFEWGGKTFHYVTSAERRFYEGDGSDWEGLYAWEFSMEDESEYLTVEKYEEDPKFYVYLQHDIEADKINVYDAGAV